jgi:hypothetical protein
MILRPYPMPPSLALDPQNATGTQPAPRLEPHVEAPAPVKTCANSVLQGLKYRVDEL